jgi:hypothetical protein
MSAQHDRLEIYICIYKLHVQSFNKIAEVKDTRRYQRVQHDKSQPKKRNRNVKKVQNFRRACALHI